jgi:hypothetical protein
MANQHPLTPPSSTPSVRGLNDAAQTGRRRHSVNGTYYAIKQFAGKRKERSPLTTDRKAAERGFRDWVANPKSDTEQGSGVLVGAKELPHRQLAAGFDRFLQLPLLASGHGLESAGKGRVTLDVLQARHSNAGQADGQG